MAATPSNIFTVLIGIDDYQGKYGNLSGCVNDVNIVKTFFEEKIGVPPGNINTLTSPLYSDSQELPTKDNVLKLIKTVSEKAAKNGPGTLFFLHYSGHGKRVRTEYHELNKGPFDEALCTLEKPLRDVEVSELLEELTNKKLAVLVVFDCCHSGGADRMDDSLGTVRSASDSDQVNLVTTGDGEIDRNTVKKGSWFYRDRNYNLIAACQPHEVARERLNEQNKKTGILTYYLNKAMENLYNSEEPVTYEKLMTHLQGLCGIGLGQQPMHLGERRRLLFGTHTVEESTDVLQAGIIKITSQNGFMFVTLNKGSAHKVDVEDRFRLYPPNQRHFGLLTNKAQHTAEAEVVEVSELRAKAKILTNTSGNEVQIAQGWFAQLVRRAKPHVVCFNTNNPSGSQNEYIERLQKDWKQITSGPLGLPVDLKFFPNQAAMIGDHILQVKMENDTSLRFFDSTGTVMDHVPSLKIDDADIAKKLAYLTPRLCSYRSLASLSPARVASKEVLYDFSVEKLEGLVDEDGGVLKGSAYVMKFRNKSSFIIYVTIFNLGPAYGVKQVFPDGNASSFAVDPNECIPEYPFGSQAPTLLKDISKQPSFQMREVYKVLITTKQADFGHYAQPDLEDWSTWKGVEPEHARNWVPIQRSLGNFWVDTKEIIITSSDLSDICDNSPDDTQNNPPHGANGQQTNGVHDKQPNEVDDKQPNGVAGSNQPNGANNSGSGVDAKPDASSKIELGWFGKRPSGWESD